MRPSRKSARPIRAGSAGSGPGGAPPDRRWSPGPLELGLHLVAGRSVFLRPRDLVHHIPVAELGVTPAALRLVGRQPLEDVDREEGLVVTFADRHVPLTEADLL